MRSNAKLVGVVCVVVVLVAVAAWGTSYSKQSESGRYELHTLPANTRDFVVFDSQTGDAISWGNDRSEPTATHRFQLIER